MVIQERELLKILLYFIELAVDLDTLHVGLSAGHPNIDPLEVEKSLAGEELDCTKVIEKAQSIHL